MSLEHGTVPLLAPRSTDWANGPLDTNVLENNVFNAMNVCKLLKKEKVIQIKREISPYESRTRDRTVVSTTLYQQS